MSTDRRYAAGLSATLQGASVPYGYTVTIWCSGEALVGLRGHPRVGLAVLFVAGAVCAFAALRWASRQAEPGATAGTGSQDSRLLGALVAQAAAIGAAIGAVVAIGHLPWAADWPLAGFAATAVYMCGTAAGVALRGQD